MKIKKHRFNLELTPDQMKKLEILQKMTCAASISETLRRAVDVHLAIIPLGEENQIFIRYGNGKEAKLIIV